MKATTSNLQQPDERRLVLLLERHHVEDTDAPVVGYLHRLARKPNRLALEVMAS